MDSNFIGQIAASLIPVSNAIILSTASIQPPSTLIQINDWLPSLTAIIVVIVGGVITYMVTFKLESKKRKYELKKDTFIQLLNILSELKSIRYDIGHKGKIADGDTFSDLQKRLDLTLYTLRLSGASREVLVSTEKLIKGILSDPDGDDAVLNELIPELKNDLMEKWSWRQFLR